MKKLTQILLFALTLSTVVSCKKEEKTTEDTTVKTDSIAETPKQRIISVNSAITEIISALGHQDEIVGVDVTSTYPENIKTTAKDLGHIRSISIESIVALKPTMIFAAEGEISPELLEKLKASGIKPAIFTQEFTVEGARKLIADVAGALEHADYKALQDKMDADLKNVKPIAKAPKVLFIYARGSNNMMVSGTGTPEDALIKMAGGKNAVTGFADFKPLTPEALIQGNPDVIFMYDSGIKGLGGAEGVLKIPGMNKTNAGKNKKIITMDGGLVHSFGPRLGEAAVQLNSLLLENAK
jgi:iron complex transport system substrate-binding protein